MNDLEKSRTSSELPQFVEGHIQEVWSFCRYMLPLDFDVEDVVYTVFREFASKVKKKKLSREHHWETPNLRVQLFQIAWKHIQRTSENRVVFWTPGRDTRKLVALEENILSKNTTNPTNEETVVPRLEQVAIEFRAPLVLKDVLRFEDEEILRVLNLRWGVFRHRLHRGRLEIRDHLRGATH